MDSNRVLKGLRDKALWRVMPAEEWCLLVCIRLARGEPWEACWLLEREVYLLRDMTYTGRIEDWAYFETGAVNRAGRERVEEKA